ncbi:MAG: heme-binding protein [Actinomycetota bacterium]
MEHLDLPTADAIIGAVFTRGVELGCGRLTAAVLDPGGHLIVLKRQDGSEFLRVSVAIGKAYGVLGMGLPGRVMAERATHVPLFFGALSDMSGGRVVPVAGGVIIRSEDGAVLGSIGVSGDTSDRDEACAVFGIESTGLFADYGQNPGWRRP